MSPPGKDPVASREPAPQQPLNYAVLAFLKQAGLEQYTLRLLDSGFDDMPTLQEITDADMKDVGIPAEAAALLRRRLQELRRGREEACPGFDTLHPVVVFLRDAGVGQYANMLLASGFDEMETLLEIEDSDLKELGVPRGHALKLRRRLRLYELEKCAQQETPQTYRLVRTLQHQPAMPSDARCEPQLPTAAGKSAVERSWEQLQALGTFTVAECLYKNTFRLCPAAVHLFPPAVRDKYREWTADGPAVDDGMYKSPALRKLFNKYVNAVGCAVVGLHEPHLLVPMLRQLGARHYQYGVGEAHFEVMGQAFNMTLRELLREDFTREVELAWSMVYSFMAGIMISGLHSAIAAPRASVEYDSSKDTSFQPFPAEHTLAGTLYSA